VRNATYILLSVDEVGMGATRLATSRRGENWADLRSKLGKTPDPVTGFF